MVVVDVAAVVTCRGRYTGFTAFWGRPVVALESGERLGEKDSVIET